MRALAGLPVLALIGGCATVTPDQVVTDLAPWSDRAGTPTANLAVGAQDQRERAERIERLLSAPIDEGAAVELALAASPALQALLAESWQQQSRSAMTGALPAPVFSFERIAGEDAVSITRMLAIGLAELVTLPMRRDAAARAIQAQRLQLAADVLKTTGAVRQQWVRAVAAGQLARYQAKVRDAAQAGAELARRMQAVGNFSRTQRAREQVFVHEAAAQLARAELAASTEHEALARLLGLDEARRSRMTLPQQLPELPTAPRSADDVARAAMGERLDLRLAQAQWLAARRAESPALAAAFDAELAAIRESATGGERARGFELALRLPLDAGARSQVASAGTLAALRRMEQARIDASSVLRERFQAYRTAHDLALQQRDQVLALRTTIAEEAVLRYNGMLIGVFELLAEARAQAAAVIATIDAQRDFWLADAALNAALLGLPSSAPALSASMPAAADAGGGH